MPDVSIAKHDIQTLVDDLHARFGDLRDGEVAARTPRLPAADPDRFGICLATVQGRTFEAGDCDTPFTLQAIAHPLAFGMALEEVGADSLGPHVGVEPSDDAFDATRLPQGDSRPSNPMINAGAIAVAALLCSRDGDAAFDRLLDRVSTAAGRRLAIDEAVYESERFAGDPDEAIAYLQRRLGMPAAQARRALDFYCRQRSLVVTCRDLAMIAATLANMGGNPLTGAGAFGVGTVRDILSVMFTCGMYDVSGRWACRVGLPAKSSANGGVIAVVNRLLGIGTYSPRLDAHGNSRRGTEVCVELASGLGLHVFDCVNVGSSYLNALL